MELLELTESTKKLFGIDEISELGPALMSALESHDESIMQSFCDMVDGDLSKDWLQMIYQYNCADRKEKKQDYTPKCLADFMGRLVGDADTVVDMCAGSGALIIQKWNRSKDQKFRAYEIDENVIPYLLFNLTIRNIQATVYRADVLNDEVFEQWSIQKGEEYGRVSRVKSAI